MPGGLKLPLAMLLCGVFIVGGLTVDSWLPLVQGDYDGSAAGRGGDALSGRHGEALQGGANGGRASGSHAEALEGKNADGRADSATGRGRGGTSGGRDSRQVSARDGADTDADATGSADDAEGGEEEALKEEEPGPIETEEGQKINPNVTGVLWTVRGSRIRGWVQDKFEPEAEIYVEIQIDDEPCYDVRAGQRRDHPRLGVIWYFDVKDAKELNDSEKHMVRALAWRKDQHGKTELRGSPRARDVGAYPRGKLEDASPEKGIAGYAWDPDTPDKPCSVIVRVDGETVAEIKADSANEELKSRRIAPTANCAFQVPWPAMLDDGLEHTVQVFAVDTDRGTEHELDGSPRALNSRAGVANEPPIGRFDTCNKVVLAGWAWDPDADTGSIDVEIWVDGEFFTAVPANSKRVTLRNSNITPDPYHGFVTTTPSRMLDGKTHTVRVYARNHPEGVKVELEGSPRQYRLEENTPPMGGFWRADEQLLRGWAADPDLGAEASEIEIYIDGKLWKRTMADRSESWIVGTGYAPNPEHGFAIKPPEWVKDGEEHTVQILALNSPEGPPKNLGTRTIGVASIYPGFWTSDRLLDTRVEQGLYVRGVSPWYDAYHNDVKPGDVLIEFDGIQAGVNEERDGDGEVVTPGTMTEGFREWLNANKEKNDILRCRFWRDGDTYEVDIKMGQLRGR